MTLNGSLRAALLVTLWAGPVHAAQFRAEVVRIVDGDTVVVVAGGQQTRIRVAGIDAPERGQAFGEKSRQHLADLLFRHTVVIDWDKLDRYGRTIGKILDGDTDAGLSQIQTGFAWHYKKYAREQTEADRLSYATAENSAREDRAGVWSEPSPVAPWEWRKR